MAATEALPGRLGEWLSPRDLAVPGLRLFCLPHAGSGAAGFYQWRRFAPAELAICPVLLPGRDSRIAEAPAESQGEVIAGLMQCCAGALEQPYAIFGHSMGALLAFEWARAIERRGMRLPECVFVSGRVAPQRESPGGMATAATALHGLADAEFLAELQRRYGGSHAALLADEELRSVFLPVLRADLRLVESYRCAPGPPLQCRVRAFAGEYDPSVSDAGLQGWSEWAGRDFAVQRFAGDHFYTLGGARPELLRAVAAAVR